ncbi:hypothetical protein CR513_42027, partial [Mucuna pruriens]
MQLWLREVKHAPDVRSNLIFVHMLDDGGYDNHFGHGKWKLTKGNLVVARGEKNSKVYWTKALVAKDSVNAMNMEASLWHRRLSHINEKWLTCLAKKDMFLGLKNVELEKCSHCMAGKQQGIKHEKTPPKTPQLNDLAERMNRTLIERVRCMLSKARLPKHFWGEALYTAVHVINLNPTVALNTKVLDKIWFGKDIKYDHLRVFDCKAFMHVPKDERSKLDMKTRQCIFIGYGHDEYGYKMYDPVEKKL